MSNIFPNEDNTLAENICKVVGHDYNSNFFCDRCHNFDKVAYDNKVIADREASKVYYELQQQQQQAQDVNAKAIKDMLNILDRLMDN